MISTVDAATEVRPAAGMSVQSWLGTALVAIPALHAMLLLVPGSHTIAASRLATSAMPMLTALCGLWRAGQVPERERLPWRLLSASLMLWAAGQAVEALIGQSSAALNFKADGADFLNVIAAFPMLLTVSNTRRTESLRTVFYLDSAQIVLAGILTYVLLYRMVLPARQAATAMAGVYVAECLVLAVSAVVRFVTWSTFEERRRIHLLGAGVWLFLPVNVGMNYATSHWNLHAGTMADLLWSVPFAFAGWQGLHLPTNEPGGAKRTPSRRSRLLVESLCPLLIMASVFALAASIVSQHPVMGLGAIFLLLLIQSLHAGVVQLNYLAGQSLLLEREQELRVANGELERLSMLDPLTGIPNRRRFDAAFEEAWRRAMRKRTPVALMIIDVDYFKGINDLHGHSYGDECLVTVARIVGKQAQRPDDLLARYGGDEFVLLLPETDTRGASAVASRIHAAMERLALVNGASPFEHRITASIGIGVGDAKQGTSAAWLLDSADRALYEAKRLGRNQTCTRLI